MKRVSALLPPRGMDRVIAESTAGKIKGALSALCELLRKANDKAPQMRRIVIPVAERLGQNVVDFEDLRKDLAIRF